MTNHCGLFWVTGRKLCIQCTGTATTIEASRWVKGWAASGNAASQHVNGFRKNLCSMGCRPQPEPWAGLCLCGETSVWRKNPLGLRLNLKNLIPKNKNNDSRSWSLTTNLMYFGLLFTVIIKYMHLLMKMYLFDRSSVFQDTEGNTEFPIADIKITICPGYFSVTTVQTHQMWQ